MLSVTHTQATGSKEIKNILSNYVTDSERMNTIISCLSEQNEHQKVSMKKEVLKIFGALGQIFEDKIIEFLPKILQALNKRIKAGEQQLWPFIGDSLGWLISFL